MTEGAQAGWRFLATKRWLGYFSLLVVFSIACVWLGSWQFERRAEARAEIDRIDNNYDAPAVPLERVVPDRESFDEAEYKWQTVEIEGEYLGEPLLARNRPGEGTVGSNVVQAFALETGGVFFVDRGWVPVAGADDATLALPAAPDGLVTVTARLRASEPEIPGRDVAGRTVPSIHVPVLAETAGIALTEVYRGVYGQLSTEQPSGATGTLAERPERDEGPHLSYALQWYVFIIIAGVGVAYAARQEHRSLNPDDESVKRETERRAERKRRRGPSDAEEEDALLDA